MNDEKKRALKEILPSYRVMTWAVAVGWLVLAPPAQGAMLELEQIGFVDVEVTDNVNVTAGDKVIDFFTTVGTEVGLIADTPHIDMEAFGELGYEKFIRNAELDDWYLDVDSTGTIELSDDFLSINANLRMEELLENQTLAPATDRDTGASQARIITYNAGPIIDFTLFDRFDARFVGRYGEVDYRNIAGEDFAANLEDSVIWQGGGRITTAPVAQRLVNTIKGEYVEQDTGFELYYGLYSLSWNVLNGLDLIGRGGYEEVFEQGVTDIQGAIWTAGFTVRPGDEGLLSLEYGRRYDGPIWLGRAALPLTGKLDLVAEYDSRLETAQARLERTLTTIADLDDDFFVDRLDLPDLIELDLISGTFLSEDLRASLIYQFQPIYPWSPQRQRDPETRNGVPGTYVELEFGQTRREGFNNGLVQEATGIDLIIGREVSRQLAVTVEVGFERSTDTGAGEEATREFRTQLEARWAFTQDIYLVGTFTSQNTAFPGEGDILENVVSFSLRRRF